MANKVIITGSGITGLSSAAYLAQQGFSVEIYEKNELPGGRLRRFSSEGFTFNSGPSWSWDSQIINDFFISFDKQTSDLFKLQSLDPMFNLEMDFQNSMEVPAGKEAFCNFVEGIEKGAGLKMEKYLGKAAEKHMELRQHANLSTRSRNIFHLLSTPLFNSHAQYIRSQFKDSRIIRLLELPIPFIGVHPIVDSAKAFALNYSLYNNGLFYPEGGMYQLIEALLGILEEYNVPIHLSSPVESFDIIDGKVCGVYTHGKSFHADYFVAATDYHHAEHLILKEYRNYSESKWNKKAINSLLFYIGLNKNLSKFLPQTIHLRNPESKRKGSPFNINRTSSEATFISCPSKLDSSLVPNGMESLMVQISIPRGIEDTGKMRDHYFNRVVDLLEKILQEPVKEHIVYKRSYSSTEFENEFNTWKGNSYGWLSSIGAHGVSRWKVQNQKLQNLFYGEIPSFLGTGVASALLSGKAVAQKVAIAHTKMNN